MRRWDRLVDRYLEEYRARGLSEVTVEKVARELDRWGSWMKRRRPRPQLHEVGSDLLIRYIRGRTAFRSKATVSSTISVMRGMGDFLVRNGLWRKNPLRWMRGPKVAWGSRVPRRIGRKEMKGLWEAAATHRYGYHRYLWLAVLSALYGTGLRRGELVRLDVNDWQREEGLLLIDGRKTGWERRVPVATLGWRCLEAYLAQRHNLLERVGSTEEPALFVNKLGSRLKKGSLSQGIHALARRCGMKGATLSQFRHTCASDLLEDGVRLPEVQRLLGHQTITTTMRYLHVADPQRHEAVKVHPINEFLEAGGAR